MVPRTAPDSAVNFRFSGHESFPLRYAWLPKAVRAIAANPNAFADEESAMVELGLGKNMVRALRFWVQATRIAVAGRGLKVTDFGQAILLKKRGDPYLEDVRTLWLLHWKLATHVKEPLFAWDYMLNRWQEPEIARSRVIRVFQFEAEAMGRKLSRVTIEQHFDVFIHTYIPTRGRKAEVQEDSLDCPLVQIELLEQVGERAAENSNKGEAIYAFRREEKPEISAGLFCYCLNDFWNGRHGNEKTISFKEVATGHGSPGQIFKLPEADVRERLDAISSDSDSIFEFEESAAAQTVIRREQPDDAQMLKFIYDQQAVAI